MNASPRVGLTQCYVRVLFLMPEDSMDANADLSRMHRSIHDLPADIHAALEQKQLMAAYHARPPYQQNDYVGWIGRAKLGATRAKRLAQMLNELEQGGVYMHMSWRG